MKQDELKNQNSQDWQSHNDLNSMSEEEFQEWKKNYYKSPLENELDSMSKEEFAKWRDNMSKDPNRPMDGESPAQAKKRREAYSKQTGKVFQGWKRQSKTNPDGTESWDEEEIWATPVGSHEFYNRRNSEPVVLDKNLDRENYRKRQERRKQLWWD